MLSKYAIFCKTCLVIVTMICNITVSIKTTLLHKKLNTNRHTRRKAIDKSIWSQKEKEKIDRQNGKDLTKLSHDNSKRSTNKNKFILTWHDGWCSNLNYWRPTIGNNFFEVRWRNNLLPSTMKMKHINFFLFIFNFTKMGSNIFFPFHICMTYSSFFTFFFNCYNL